MAMMVTSEIVLSAIIKLLNGSNLLDIGSERNPKLEAAL